MSLQSAVANLQSTSERGVLRRDALREAEKARRKVEQASKSVAAEKMASGRAYIAHITFQFLKVVPLRQEAGEARKNGSFRGWNA